MLKPAPPPRLTSKTCMLNESGHIFRRDKLDNQGRITSNFRRRRAETSSIEFHPWRSDHRYRNWAL